MYILCVVIGDKRITRISMFMTFLLPHNMSSTLHSLSQNHHISFHHRQRITSSKSSLCHRGPEVDSILLLFCMTNKLGVGRRSTSVAWCGGGAWLSKRYEGNIFDIKYNFRYQGMRGRGRRRIKAQSSGDFISVGGVSLP